MVINRTLARASTDLMHFTISFLLTMICFSVSP